MTVIGIDLSLTQTGLAIAKNFRIEWTGVVKTTGKRGDNLELRTERLRDIRNLIEAQVLRYEPELAVLEAPSYGSRFGSAHDRSGLWWLVVDMLYLRNVPTALVAPQARAKYATGSGRAEKPEVTKAVNSTYGLTLKTSDEADATALAAIGAYHLDRPCEKVALFPDQYAVLEKVEWP